MRNSWFVVLGLFSLLLTAGCSVTATVDTCSLDSTVGCAFDESGYNCTGSALPPTSAGDCVGDGTGLYCCVAPLVVPSSCATDTTVTGCASPSTGYSCTGSDAPDQTDPSLSCSVGVAGNAGALLYCCLSGVTIPANTCSSDPTVAGCAAGSYGFSCVGKDSPDTYDSSLTCSTPVAGNAGSSLFCCTTGAATTTPIPTSCAVDGTVTGCASPSTGYSCTSTDAPDQTDPSLSCSIGVPGNAGSTLYCCLSGETFPAGTCAPDQTVNGCATGSYGFSCAASDTPDQTDPSLTCSIGVAGNAGSTLFCCLSSQYSWAAGTCGPDDTIGTCQPGSFGFKCAASDTPDQTDPTLVCSTGVPDADGTSTDFCCTD